MSSNTVIANMFPVPVLITSINREFSEIEINTFKEYSQSLKSNDGNGSTIEGHVFRNEQLAVLHEFCLYNVQQFVEQVYDPISEVRPYITQSWLNFIQKDEYHHLHNHPNSFLSGVLYIKADKNYDSISFVNETVYTSLQLTPKENNRFSNENVFPVKTGDLLIFPSMIKHHVKKKLDNNLRISLSFNTFLSGEIGELNKFTHLAL